MSYTKGQLAQLQQAIVDLSLGNRVAKITHNGRTVEYAASDMDELRALERSMAESLQPSGGRRTRTRMVVTNKGL
ncbi:gpW family head-tail joining protein [Halomonas piscis]|uniref:gpW family head-tail joining protein n=1 Tax=Halomonas piscis TaxID=3031727 RepID=UPI0028A0FF31|nr:gpW family head-tail joining protein [Halomonas piscis]